MKEKPLEERYLSYFRSFNKIVHSFQFNSWVPIYMYLEVIYINWAWSITFHFHVFNGKFACCCLTYEVYNINLCKWEEMKLHYWYASCFFVLPAAINACMCTMYTHIHAYIFVYLLWSQWYLWTKIHLLLLLLTFLI